MKMFGPALILFFFSLAVLAQAETPAPGWEATSTSLPTVLAPGEKGTVVVEPLNIGAANSAGTVTVVDALPAGVTATEAGELIHEPKTKDGSPELGHEFWECTGNAPGESPRAVEKFAAATVVTCTNNLATLPTITGGAGTWTGAFTPGGFNAVGRQPRIGIAVDVAPDAGEGASLNRVEISGGGALGPVSTDDPFAVGSTAGAFGFARWDGWFSNADGTLDTQAGSVPYSATFNFALNNSLNEKTGGEFQSVGGEARDDVAQLPPGFVGNPTAAAQCTRQEFDELKCPPDTQVGFARIDSSSGVDVTLEVFNMVPPPGVAAQFAFAYEQIQVFLDSGVRSGKDYGITTTADQTPQKATTGVIVTLWGVPGDPTHNVWRRGAEGGCEHGNLAPGALCNLGAHPELGALLRLPTSCGAPRSFSIWTNSYLEPVMTDEASFLAPGGEGLPSGFTGCGKLPFEPGLEAVPSTGAADSPAGLRFDLHVPQPETVTAREGKAEYPIEEQTPGEVRTNGAEPVLHEADLKDTTVTFPEGLAVNPSEADGLQACSEAQVGFTGFAELNEASEPGVQTPQFTPEPAEASEREEQEAQAGVPGEPKRCPEAAKLGAVNVKTPLLNHPLEGAIYLARQSENPFGSLLAVYITVYDPISGVVVKLPGKVETNAVTGQLSTVVDQTPQLPFEDFEIRLFEGQRAAFTTPATCGEYTTTSLLTPWSSPEAANASPTGSFAIAEASGGGACASSPAQEPNAPSFSAGTFSPIAGTYSPFTFALKREDGSQTLSSLSLTLPEGLLGKIAGIEKCPQGDIEQAEHRSHEGEGAIERANPSCPSASEIGLAHVGAGSGAPFYVTGRAYLAGPYNGAPFSVVVITPAVAGPFDLGVVVVRSGLFIDPVTAQATVKSDPFPTILDGIPLDIRSIEVEASRPGFTLNPTSCEKTAVTGTAFASSSQAPLSAPFKVGGCNGLPFKPSLTVSTKGKNSKAGGASLTVSITSRPQQEANIHSVDLTIPKTLPARLTTLQKACLASVFEANPAACPAASDIGTVVLHTPLLNVPLTGPAYLVSHGGAAFPDIEQVLQGEGVTVIVDGKTQIKDGVTYSHFDTVPDAPFTSFEFTAPQGPDSILGTNVPQSAKYSLCGQKLVMPVTLTGQNGSPLKQETKITVTGCAKVKALTRAQKLKAALKECRKRDKGAKRRHAREVCEKQAHKRYGPVKKSKKHQKKS